jgi:hypothetical protein
LKTPLTSRLLNWMFSAGIDKSGRLLRLSFAQHVGREEAAACMNQVVMLLPSIASGFCLLTDLTHLESMDLGCEPFIDQVMDACNRAGIKKVVRVIPEPNRDIGFGIMSLFHYGKDVHIVTCDNLEEAEALLGP